MKAIICTNYGSPDNFQLQEVDKPVPKDGEVLVKIHAVSINSWDWELLQATPFVNRMIAGLFKPSKIPIFGCDIAGIVEAVGANVKRFQPGDEVFGDLSASGWGGFAEYVSSSENALIRKPASMTFEQAAAIPQAALLAYQGLCDKGQIRTGQKVLINGASGGSGTFAIQIAKSYGAKITGVCSTAKMDFVRSLGADHVIDYTQEDFTKNGETYDLILDVKGFHSVFEYQRALAPNGSFVMVGGASGRILQVVFVGGLISRFSNKKLRLLLHKANKGLDAIVELFEAGKLVPVIDRTYPLSKTSEAMRNNGEGYAKGKVVITVE